MQFPRLSGFLLLSATLLASPVSSRADPVVVYLRPDSQSLVLGTIDTGDDVFRVARPISEGSEWYRTTYAGHFAGFVENSFLGPDGRVSPGAPVYLTPSTEAVQTTVIEEGDNVVVNLVDRWVEITYRKTVPAYFRKPDLPESISVEPDFAVTVPANQRESAATVVEPDFAPNARDSQATVLSSPEPEVAERELPTPPDPEVLVFEDETSTTPQVPASAEVPQEPSLIPEGPVPSDSAATVLSTTAGATYPAPPAPAPPSNPTRILPPEDLGGTESILLEPASVAGVTDTEVLRQPNNPPASGLTRRFDGRVREVNWFLRRPPYRFELVDYSGDHLAFLDLQRAVLPSFTNLSDAVVIVYGTLEAIGDSSRRVIRVQTLSRRR